MTADPWAQPAQQYTQQQGNPYGAPTTQPAAPAGAVGSWSSISGGGGGRNGTPKNVGDQIMGVCLRDVDASVVQATVYNRANPNDHSKLAFTLAGKPKWQINLQLQTNLRVDEEDDGKRTAYLAAWRSHDAIRDAAREAGRGEAGPRAGDTVLVAITGTERNGQGQSDTNLWGARVMNNETGAQGAGGTFAAPSQRPAGIPAQQPAPAQQAPAPQPRQQSIYAPLNEPRQDVQAFAQWAAQPQPAPQPAQAPLQDAFATLDAAFPGAQVQQQPSHQAPEGGWFADGGSNQEPPF